MSAVNTAIFKAYDIRGTYPDEIDEDVARDIGRAFVAYLEAKRIAVSRDMRVSSPALAEAFIDGATRPGRRRRRLRPGRHGHAVLRGARRAASTAGRRSRLRTTRSSTTA